jgi:hypothetical protein
MEKPTGLSWEVKKNENGVDMAIINRQSLVDFMLYAEEIQQKYDKIKEGANWVLSEYINHVNDSDEITERLQEMVDE